MLGMSRLLVFKLFDMLVWLSKLMDEGAFRWSPYGAPLAYACAIYACISKF
jgi:hypothetical protein